MVSAGAFGVFYDSEDVSDTLDQANDFEMKAHQVDIT